MNEKLFSFHFFTFHDLEISPKLVNVKGKLCSNDRPSLELSEETLDELTNTLFESADVDQSGSITFEELHDELLKHPGVIENLTIR